MSRIAGSPSAILYREYRRRFVPVATTLLAILLGLLPFIVTAPLFPKPGFLVLITWRLLRPEIWPANVALGFGLFDDLVSGNPLGQSMALWTSIFLLFDLVETRISYKDFWVDWLFATAAIILESAGAWYIALLMHSPSDILMLLPQVGMAILFYPVVARLVLRVDRWRLSR
jgi:rod shape-determining protein MreD